jgi:hypothetical protein
MSLGDAYVDVHADFDPFEREVRRWDPKTNRFRDEGGRFVSEFVDGAESAFEKANAPGGPFDKIGQGISDAIGSGFNVSGKSPLIYLLIPVFSELALLIVGAIQAVNALGAALTTIPALLTAIGIQVGVLYLAFHGLGKSITAAFAAKNATELNDALKNLTPSAQAFVRSLLPLRDLLDQIRRVAQESFFASLGDSLTKVANALGPIFKGAGFASLASALGRLFASVGQLLASPLFTHFVSDTIRETVLWLNKFRFGFGSFLTGLIRIADASLPLLRVLGELLNETLNDIGRWLSGAVASGGFQQWLKDMTPSLIALGDVLKNAVLTIGAFFSAVQKGGGGDALQMVAKQLEILAFTLNSEFGQQAMAGLIKLIMALSFLFIDLGVIIFALSAAINVAYLSIKEFFTWLFTVALPAIGTFFTETIPNAIFAAGDAISKFFNWLDDKIAWLLNVVTSSLKVAWDGVTDWFSKLPGRIWDAIGDLGSFLWQKGADLVNGFIGGIKSMFSALENVASDLVGKIASVLPGSPAETGPLSGQGYVKLRGQRMVNDLAAGIAGEAKRIGNTAVNTVSQVINFGGVRMEFGGVPTADQARTAGEAVGAGITSQMDVALAVRAM